MILLRQKRNLAFAGLLVVSVAIVVFTGIQMSTRAQTDQDGSQVLAGTQATAPSRVVQIEDLEWRQDIPLNAKVAQSRVIVIGTPIRNVCRWSRDGNHVTTDYDVSIEEVLKGDLQPASVISVSMPGGLVTEPDRTLLNVSARFVRQMQNGKKYIMFLKNPPAHGFAAYATLRGSQGLYEIPSNGTRLFHLGRSWELPPADDGEPITEFIQQVRDQVRRRY